MKEQSCRMPVCCGPLHARQAHDDFTHPQRTLLLHSVLFLSHNRCDLPLLALALSLFDASLAVGCTACRFGRVPLYIISHL
jgi:hypothetical protein